MSEAIRIRESVVVSREYFEETYTPERIRELWCDETPETCLVLALLERWQEAERRLAQWEAIAERDHGSPIETIDEIRVDRDCLAKEFAAIRAERDELAAIAQDQHELLAAKLTWPPANNKCGWCVHAAGDNQSAAESATTYTLEDVRAHSLVCPHNPVTAERDAAIARAEFAEKQVNLRIEEGNEARRCYAHWRDRAEMAEAKLASVEAERDAVAHKLDIAMNRMDGYWDGLRQHTAEEIAAWLDERSKHHEAKRDKAGSQHDEDEHGWAASYADGWAADIRAGAWRQKEQP